MDIKDFHINGQFLASFTSLHLTTAADFMFALCQLLLIRLITPTGVLRLALASHRMARLVLFPIDHIRLCDSIY